MLRTLSRLESRIVLELQWLEKTTVTLDAIQEVLRGDRQQAWSVAHRLIQKGWLERLKRGHYRLIPAERGVEGIPDLNPYRIEAILNKPHFFSYGTACKYHGFTDQVLPRYYIAVESQRPNLEIRGIQYIFVQVQEALFFGWETVDVYHISVPMADPCRALLDALDRPQYVGGIGEASLIVRNAARRIDWTRTLEYLERFQTAALAQRLGYFLDMHQVDYPKKVQRALLRSVSRLRKVPVGSRHRWGGQGKIHPLWNVIENVPREHLLDRTKEGGARP